MLINTLLLNGAMAQLTRRAAYNIPKHFNVGSNPGSDVLNKF